MVLDYLVAGRCWSLKRAILILGALGFCLGFASYVQAGVYTISRKSQWEEWDFPKGTIEIGWDGVKPVYFRENINAALDAWRFKHWNATGDSSYGGIKGVGSNPAAARNIIDGNPNTWWSPNENDSLKDWWIEVDLGRAVPAKQIRLVFPSMDGARPFEYFTVYVSDGARLYTGRDLWIYERVWRASKPNKANTINIKLQSIVTDTTAQGIETVQQIDFKQVQYVRIVLDAKSQSPALAELEVYSIGDNIAFGTIERGGSIEAGVSPGTAPKMFDGDIGTYWAVEYYSEPTEFEGPRAWFKWDLGAVFRVNQIVIWQGNTTFMPRVLSYRLRGYIMMSSDGSKTPEGELKLDKLADVDNYSKLPHWVNFNHIFPSRPVRYIFWKHAHNPTVAKGTARINEIQIFGKGYPVEVTLTSNFINLGRGKNITRLEWQADTPPGAELKIRSRTGDTMLKIKHWYKIDGTEVPESTWKKLPRPLKGNVIEEIKPGDDWSNWGEEYDFSGQAFFSPSPRQYVQLQARLISKTPEAAVKLRSISIHYTEPLVAEVKGRIEPREVDADKWKDFVYWIKSTYSPGNPGFDRVLIKLPSGATVEEETVEIEVRGKVSRPESVWSKGDSLIVQMPAKVLRDSVAVRFKGKLLRNGSLFKGFIGNSQISGIWQRIDPQSRGSTTVLLPGLAQSEELITNFSLTPKVITPNGDGVNDEVEINFIVLKVMEKAEVKIYNLEGEIIRELRSQPEGDVYIWDGRDSEGNKVLPGVYICRVHVDAQSGKNVENRVISVIY
nr:hypothetical protein [Desulfobacterales bacterium]